MPKQPAIPAPRRERFLADVDEAVPWDRLLALAGPHYTKAGPRGGPPPVPLKTMLRVHFLQNWYALGDPMVEGSLHGSEAMRRFAGIEPGDGRVPDETTISGFRRLLETRGLAEKLFAKANACLLDRVIARIREACGDGEAVFRGEYRKYADPASSAIYQKNRGNAGGRLFSHDRFQPGDVEREIVEKARREAFSPNVPTKDILADLRHFGADTALVDFSKDMLVALFFACNGEPEGDEEDLNGRVWVLPTQDVEKPDEPDRERIHGEDRRKDETILITPGQTGLSGNRVGAQSSIFVHARQGFVDTGRMEEVEIWHELKQGFLAYLEKFHDISHGTIYNDLVGFVRNEQNFKTARIYFFEGLYKRRDGDYKGAIADYDEAIRRRRDYPEAFNNRGIAKRRDGDYKGAIADYDEAIRRRRDYPEAFNNRGIAKRRDGDHKGAIADFGEAIRLRPDYPEAFNNRGIAKAKLGDLGAAIADFGEAIRLRPDYPAARKGLDRVRERLGERGGGIDGDD